MARSVLAPTDPTTERRGYLRRAAAYTLTVPLAMLGAWTALAAGASPASTPQPEEAVAAVDDISTLGTSSAAGMVTTVGATAAGPGYATGAVVTIRGEISDVTYESLKRRVEQARAEGAKIIVFEIDTPGGMVSSALDICDLIKNLIEVKTVAWVHTDAYSAGSMIAMACDEIVMSPASVIGDCGVILGGPTGPAEVPEELRAKAESPVIEQFRDSAARNGYNGLLCESLVVKERVVYWIENRDTGERRFVNAKDKKRLAGGDEEGEVSPFAPAVEAEEETESYQWVLVESYEDTLLGKTVPISQPVVPETELLTMSQSKASAFGFCKAIVTGDDALMARYQIDSSLLRFEANWSENFTAWMTSMPVRMFLLIIILLGAYVEFNTPGVGVPGLVALICLAIFVGAPYMTGLANVWELIIIVLGMVLIGAEIFVIPGFGVAGLSGIFLVMIGLLATFVPEEPGRTFPIYIPRFEDGLAGLRVGVITLGSGLAGGLVAMAIVSRIMPRLPWMKVVMPANPESEPTLVSDPYHGYAREGDAGMVESALRPAGKARFGDVLVDVVSEGDLIEPGVEVRVVDRQGNRVVVRRVD